MTKLERENLIQRLLSDKEFLDTFISDRHQLRFYEFIEKYNINKSFFYSKIFQLFREELELSEEEKQEHRERTCYERLGVKTPWNSEEVIETRKQNYLVNRGVENPFQDPEVKARIKETNLERLDVEYPMQSKKIRQKSIETCNRVYKVDNISQCNEIKVKKRKKSGKKYRYNNIIFDSSWELCYYIYCVDNNFDIIREPISLPYIGADGLEHLYFPDFAVDGQLIEIKANWKLDDNRKLIDNKEKQKCMEDNNVSVITNPEINQYIEYVINNYGKDFIEKCKKQSATK